MGERDFVLRYRMSRKYADNQAVRLHDGIPLVGWTHASDWKVGEPEPATVTLIGSAWVAHCYDIAREDAELLASRDRAWQRSVEECQRKADSYRKSI